MRKVIEYILEQNLIESGDHVILGVSGGADSVFLLCVLLELKKQMEFSVTVVHINHQLRREAVDEMQFVQDLCGQHHLDCRSFSVDIRERARRERMSLEEAGRKARYELFYRVMEEEHGTKIAVAHHQNDQAETFLYRAARGTGIYGAGAMRPFDPPVIRPLLCSKKQEIQEELKQIGQIWVEDKSNQDNAFARNRLRNEVIPQLEKVNHRAVEHLAFLTEDLREAGEYLSEQIRDGFERVASELRDGYRLDCGRMENEHLWMQKQIIKTALEKTAGRKKDLLKSHVESVWNLLGKETGKRISLPYEMTAQKSYGDLLIQRDSGDFEWKGTLFQAEITDFSNISEKDCIKIIDYDRIEKGIQLRCRRPGDFFVFGKEKRKKLLSRYFIDEKVPRAFRDRIPLAADGSHIVWIIGRRVSDHYKVSEETRRYMKLEFKREGDERNGRNQSDDFGGKGK